MWKLSFIFGTKHIQIFSPYSLIVVESKRLWTLSCCLSCLSLLSRVVMNIRPWSDNHLKLIGITATPTSISWTLIPSDPLENPSSYLWGVCYMAIVLPITYSERIRNARHRASNAFVVKLSLAIISLFPGIWFRNWNRKRTVSLANLDFHYYFFPG